MPVWHFQGPIEPKGAQNGLSRHAWKRKTRVTQPWLNEFFGQRRISHTDTCHARSHVKSFTRMLGGWGNILAAFVFLNRASGNWRRMFQSRESVSWRLVPNAPRELTKRPQRQNKQAPWESRTPRTLTPFWLLVMSLPGYPPRFPM